MTVSYTHLDVYKRQDYATVTYDDTTLYSRNINTIRRFLITLGVAIFPYNIKNPRFKRSQVSHFKFENIGFKYTVYRQPLQIA